jgi:hypothetical protein
VVLTAEYVTGTVRAADPAACSPVKLNVPLADSADDFSGGLGRHGERGLSAGIGRARQADDRVGVKTA